MRSKAICLIGLLLLTATIGPGACSRGGDPGKVEIVTIGVPPLEQNALLYIADQKKFFADHGLRIVIKDYDSGVKAVGALLKEEVDLAETAEFPFVQAAFQKEKIRIIACNDKFENDYIVARKDRGISKISDLKGKRIGLTLKTINEFYLGRFLALNGLNIRDVIHVDLAPAQYLKALTGGEVEAIIAWQPYVDRIRKEVGGVVVWPGQSSQPAFGLLVGRQDWLIQHAVTVKHFLKSLAQAEEYLQRHPDEAKAIVQKRLNYDDAYLASVWPLHRFRLSLDQTLIVAMKDEAQWMINNNLIGETQIPDLGGFLHTDSLQAVRPEAVTIIR
ncbi:MAG: NrtA/SsuA/CpmA family ABC transporter substrate-binding protein [Deltaproteobacteria bacterium]|nr:NrtA/SsuA/CpmA family ABC transporter substrate-binding protein [Deltaproteobacteria bacterium]